MKKKQLPTRKCEWCGAEYTPGRVTAKYCSRVHAVKARNAHRSEPIPERPCDACGEVYQPKRSDQRYHSSVCARRALNESRRPTEAEREATHQVREAVRLDEALRRNRELSQDLKTAKEELHELKKRLEFEQAVGAVLLKPPTWARKPVRKAKGHRATVCLMLSDTHFDEVVRPEEVDWINAYDRKIAKLRLERTFERAAVLARDYLKGVEYDGAALFLGGDLVSGLIHEELRETNEAPIMETVLYWSEQIAAGVRFMAEEFGALLVASTPGNHGRNTRKPRFKSRAQDNFDWLISKLVHRYLSDDKRISWHVPDSMDTQIKIYDWTFQLTHGDQFTGGNGIAGIWSPVMRGHHKKSRKQTIVRKPYDTLLIGHFHQYVTGKGFIVNGSLKGYDEYAYGGNFDPEPPQQAFWLTTPEHGITFSAPILSGNREKEGW